VNGLTCWAEGPSRPIPESVPIDLLLPLGLAVLRLAAGIATVAVLAEALALKGVAPTVGRGGAVVGAALKLALGAVERLFAVAPAGLQIALAATEALGLALLLAACLAEEGCLTVTLGALDVACAAPVARARGLERVENGVGIRALPKGATPTGVKRVAIALADGGVALAVPAALVVLELSFGAGARTVLEITCLLRAVVVGLGALDALAVELVA